MKKALTVAAINFALGVFALIAAIYVYLNYSSEPLKNYGPAPSFTLTDTDGADFSSDALADKIYVADFFFSTCAGPCPTMSANMKKIQDHFEGREDVALASFTVNPIYDTPEVLAKYAAKLRADTRQWRFLTGTVEELLRISVDGFMIGDPDNLMNHSQKFVLVDRAGLIRGYFEGTSDEEVKQLIKAIERLRKEQKIVSS
jgi:protein SCO1/2